jgi:hypothetical protein
MLAIKPKFCGWFFHTWTQIYKRKEMTYKGWRHTGLLSSFIPTFQTEALGVNATKFLFSSNLTKEAKIEDPNGHEDSDLDLDLEENT